MEALSNTKELPAREVPIWQPTETQQISTIQIQLRIPLDLFVNRNFLVLFGMQENNDP